MRLQMENHIVSTVLRNGKKSPCLIKVHNAHREINDGNATHQFISFHRNYEWITVRVSFDSCLFGDHGVHILLIDFPIDIPTWYGEQGTSDIQLHISPICITMTFLFRFTLSVIVPSLRFQSSRTQFKRNSFLY